MAISDTHKAYIALAAGGFTETQAQTLIETLSESGNSLATKADIADMATKADLQAVRADMQALEQALKADIQALEQNTKADLRELELRVDARFDAVDARFGAVDARFDAVDAQFDSVEQRMTIRLGAMLIAAVALIVTIQGVLLALFLNA